MNKYSQLADISQLIKNDYKDGNDNTEVIDKIIIKLNNLGYSISSVTVVDNNLYASENGSDKFSIVFDFSGKHMMQLAIFDPEYM